MHIKYILDFDICESFKILAIDSVTVFEVDGTW
jgi:hypothetical protein